jgi:hypothetical protein
VLKQKALDKEVVNKIGKLKAKEKDTRWVQDTFTQVEKTIQRSVIKNEVTHTQNAKHVYTKQQIHSPNFTLA